MKGFIEVTLVDGKMSINVNDIVLFYDKNIGIRKLGEYIQRYEVFESLKEIKELIKKAKEG